MSFDKKEELVSAIDRYYVQDEWDAFLDADGEAGEWLTNLIKEPKVRDLIDICMKRMNKEAYGLVEHLLSME